jgi:hypothetical protein
MSKLPVIVIGRAESVKNAINRKFANNTLTIHLQCKSYKNLKSTRPINVIYHNTTDHDMPELVYKLVSDNVAVLINPKNDWYNSLSWHCVNYVTPRAATRYFCGVEEAPPALLTATNVIKLKTPGYMITAASLTLIDEISSRNVEIAINACIELLQDREYITDLIIPASLLNV